MTPTFASHLRHLEAIRGAFVAAADPARLVRRALERTPTGLRAGDLEIGLSGEARVGIVAAGKAALGMARAAVEIVAPRLAGAVVAHPRGIAPERAWPAPVGFFEAGHPLPNEGSVAAARAAMGLCEALRDGDLLLGLISGGASALLEAPRAGITLEEIRSLTSAMQLRGADIHELNVVRRALSSVKAGGLARKAAPARVLTLVLSDVPGDDPAEVGSGPTVPSSVRGGLALHVLERYGLASTNPAVAACLASLHEKDAPNDDRTGAVIVGTNAVALEAARRAAADLGFDVVVDGPLEGEASHAGRSLAEAALRIRARSARLPACILRGGETTVSVRGRGRGGRSQELTLASAVALEGQPAIAAMGFSSDGIDGPTDAAGAVATGDSARRGVALGLSAPGALTDNDSHRFFGTLGDLVHTGPTGTNVGDLAVALVYPDP